ncbi:MAG TPA: glycosyltransferase family 4 protein [Actinomycetes bacterium]
MVTKFLPLPANSGGKQRSLAILRRLAARGEVTLCAFDDGTADREGLRALGVQVRSVPWAPARTRQLGGVVRTGTLSAGRFWERRLAGQVRAAMADGEARLLQVEYAQLAPYLSLGRAHLRVLDLHNVESSLAASYARGADPVRATVARVESAALRRLERWALGVADVVSVVSERDRDRLPRSPRRLLVCPNGWEPGAPLPPASGPVAAFVALMGWRPNQDAALWLVERVWPGVLRRVPDARLLLVGRDPGPALRRLAGPAVEVTGSVEQVRPHLARARVALAPLRSGGGTRLKILEALDAGRPVVATTVGAEGLECLVGNGLTIVDDPDGMAERIAALLRDPARATELGRRGSAAVAARYSWDRTLSPLLDQLAGTP